MRTEAGWTQLLAAVERQGRVCRSHHGGIVHVQLATVMLHSGRSRLHASFERHVAAVRLGTLSSITGAAVTIAIATAVVIATALVGGTVVAAPTPHMSVDIRVLVVVVLIIVVLVLVLVVGQAPALAPAPRDLAGPGLAVGGIDVVDMDGMGVERFQVSLQDVAGVVSSCRGPAGRPGSGSPACILAVAEAAPERPLARVRALMAAQVFALLEGAGAVCAALELWLGDSCFVARPVRRVGLHELGLNRTGRSGHGASGSSAMEASGDGNGDGELDSYSGESLVAQSAVYCGYGMLEVPWALQRPAAPHGEAAHGLISKELLISRMRSSQLPTPQCCGTGKSRPAERSLLQLDPLN